MRRLARWRPSRAAAIVLAGVLLASLWALRHAGTALVVSKDVGPPDAIVVLASHEWERIPAAASLARQYPSSLVLLTRPRVVTKYNCHLCGERAAWLQHEGVAAKRIVVLPYGTSSTRDEALAVRRVITARKIRRLLVVTSPYHSRRALHVFEQAMAGADVVTGVAPATATSQADPVRWWRHPYDRWYVRYEWAALFYYRIKFGVALD